MRGNTLAGRLCASFPRKRFAKAFFAHFLFWVSSSFPDVGELK
jgi:hypothetical protein